MKALKKITALALILVLSVSTLNLNVFANEQKPVEQLKVEKIDSKKGYHPITNKLILSPEIKIGWDDPAMWDTSGDYHEPSRYLITIKDSILNKVEKTISIPYSNQNKHKEVELDDYYNFKTGSLYGIKVEPEHEHKTDSGTIVKRPVNAQPIYAITDLNLELKASDNEITVTWDELNLDNVTYKITYAQVDYNDGDPRSKFENSSKKFEFTVNKDTWQKVEGENKLQYTIKDNIEPAKPYAVIVEPIVDLPGKTVFVNNTPNIFRCHTRIGLKVIEDGDYIRFEWDINDSFKLNDGDYILDNTVIYEYVDGAIEGQPVVEFPGTNGASIHYYKIKKKDAQLEYQLVLRYEGYNDLVKSDKIPFIPTGLKIKPNKPIIPKPISKNIVNQLKSFLDNGVVEGTLKNEIEDYYNNGEHTKQETVEKILSDYLVQGDNYNVNELEYLLSKNITFQILPDGGGINLVWSSFRRKDYNKDSNTYNQKITDFDVYYDIWVTNELGEISTLPKVESDLKISPTIDTQKQLENSEGKVIGFKQPITKYAAPNKQGLQDIVPNQLYYIKIVAKKKFGGEELISEPEIATIYYNYNGDAYAPPIMSKPPLKLREDEITKKSAAIEWRKEWYEVTAVSPTAEAVTGVAEKWEHEVWAQKDGLIYKEKAEGRQHFLLEKEQDINELKAYIGEDNFNNNYIYRKIDLGKDPFNISDVKYNFVKYNYDEVSQIIEARKKKNKDYNLKDYIKDLLQDEKDGLTTINWKQITPTEDKDDNMILTYEETGLRPNHSYIFLLRPYRELFNGDILMAFYPAALVVSTLDEHGDLNPTPAVPYLEVDSGYSDNEVTLIWDYNSDFDYELCYSKNEDIEKAEKIEWSILKDYKEDEIPKHIKDYKFKVDDLFPGTVYYFWIRAKSKATGKISFWSNPVMGITKDVEAPLPPRGIGMGSKEKISKYDIKEPVSKDYITVEWILNQNDMFGKQEKQTKKIKKAYSYILEVADNPEFLDMTRMEISDDNVGAGSNGNQILDKNLVKINNLIANRVYYVRMKTKVIVSSDNVDTTIEKESKYSYMIWLITNASGSEYDGVKDPSKEVLPDKDYELIYDKDKKELIYRFRTDKEGDKNTDQRLISDLIAKNAFEYVVNVDKYKDKEINKRIIKIADNIVKAFDEYKVNLVINAGDTKIEIPYEAFKNQYYNNAYSYGNSPQYILTINTWSDYKQGHNKPKNTDKILSKTEGFKVEADNDLISYDINYTEKPFTVKIRPTSRYELYDNQVDTYQYDSKVNKWERTNGQLEKFKGLMSFKTGVVGAYGIFAKKDNVKETSNHWSEPYRKSVFKKINIIGLDSNYNPDSAVSGRKVLNIITGLMENKKDIDINSKISESKLKQLQYAGLIKNMDVNSSYVTRVNAVDMFVKAYENMKGKPIYHTGTANTAQQKNEEKAYSVGIINSVKLARPNDKLTYGEMFSILDNILE